MLSQKGSFYYYGEKKLGQGKEAAKMALKANEELFEEITKKVLEVLSNEQ